jgi:Zn-dependent membrane protease YugP
MFKAQFKTRTPFEKWTNIGSYGTESQAISAAMMKKRNGAVMVRVVNKSGAVVYTG